ncbi:MAG: M24 family metallopeptidase, partial [Bacteroides sp.]|nr:M24 family metallopeptidase [Bacteroides sp.]
MKRLTPDEYPQEIEDKLQDYNKKDYLIPSINLLRTKSQIEGIRKSAAINTALLNYITPFITEGTTTEEIDKLVYDFTTKQGAIPATLNYEGFPKSVCISINDVVCHGIPSPYETFLDGDIVNIDVSTIYNGYFSDASRMFLIGDVSEEDKKLVRVAKECLELG